MAAADAFDFEIVKNTRAKSDIWRYFGLKKRKLDQQIEEHVAVCRECHATVRCTGGGTSNLSTHVRRHHFGANWWSLPKLQVTRYIAVRIAVRTSVPWYTAVRKFVAVPTPSF